MWRAVPGASVLGAVVLLGLAACGRDDGAGIDGRTAGQTGTTAATTSTPAPGPAVEDVEGVEGVAGEVVRLRTDEALGGQVQVRLTNTGDVPFGVAAVALRSAAFADQPLRPQTATYRPGQTIDLPVPFGAVDCTAAVAPVAAEVQLSHDGGPAETVLVPLSGDAMETVYAEECAVQRVLDHVSIAVTGFTDDGDAVAGDVVLTRVPGSADVDVEVLALGRSVLLDPVTEHPLPTTLAAGEDELVLPLTVAPASCDPHVLAETKKPFVFPLRVQVAGESAPVDLPLDEEQRAGLQALVDRVC